MGAANTGYKNPSSYTTINVGFDWINPNYGRVMNDSRYARVDTSGSGYTDWYVTYNYGFSVSSSYKITGFDVGIRDAQSGTIDVHKERIQNYRGSLQGTYKTDSTRLSRYSTFTLKYYGRASDLWGCSGATDPSYVNSSSFGWAVYYHNNSSYSPSIYLDGMRSCVYYYIPDPKSVTDTTSAQDNLTQTGRTLPDQLGGGDLYDVLRKIYQSDLLSRNEYLYIKNKINILDARSGLDYSSIAKKTNLVDLAFSTDSLKYTAKIRGYDNLYCQEVYKFSAKLNNPELITTTESPKIKTTQGIIEPQTYIENLPLKKYTFLLEPTTETTTITKKQTATKLLDTTISTDYGTTNKKSYLQELNTLTEKNIPTKKITETINNITKTLINTLTQITETTTPLELITLKVLIKTYTTLTNIEQINIKNQLYTQTTANHLEIPQIHKKTELQENIYPLETDIEKNLITLEDPTDPEETPIKTLKEPENINHKSEWGIQTKIKEPENLTTQTIIQSKINTQIQDPITTLEQEKLKNNIKITTTNNLIPEINTIIKLHETEEITQQEINLLTKQIIDQQNTIEQINKGIKTQELPQISYNIDFTTKTQINTLETLTDTIKTKTYLLLIEKRETNEELSLKNNNSIYDLILTQEILTKHWKTQESLFTIDNTKINKNISETINTTQFIKTLINFILTSPTTSNDIFNFQKKTEIITQISSIDEIKNKVEITQSSNIAPIERFSQANKFSQTDSLIINEYIEKTLDILEDYRLIDSLILTIIEGETPQIIEELQKNIFLKEISTGETVNIIKTFLYLTGNYSLEDQISIYLIIKEWENTYINEILQVLAKIIQQDTTTITDNLITLFTITEQTLTKIILTINKALEDIINEYSETILKIHNKIEEYPLDTEFLKIIQPIEEEEISHGEDKTPQHKGKIDDTIDLTEDITKINSSRLIDTFIPIDIFQLKIYAYLKELLEIYEKTKKLQNIADEGFLEEEGKISTKLKQEEIINSSINILTNKIIFQRNSIISYEKLIKQLRASEYINSRENTPILKKILDNSFYISDRVNKLMRVFERIVGNQILFLNKVFLLSEVIHLRDKIIWIILEYKFYVTFTRIYEYKFLFTTKYYLENEFIRNYLFEVNKKNINIEFLIRRTYYVTIVLLKKANFISNIYKNTTLK